MSAVNADRKQLINQYISVINETASEEDAGTTRRNLPKYQYTAYNT